MGYLAKFDDIITRKRKEALKALAASQWRCDNVLKFIESVRYQILEGSFIRCSRYLNAIALSRFRSLLLITAYLRFHSPYTPRDH